MVGRQSELRTLEALLAGLGRGAPGFVELVGEPGIGKTRLLDALSTRGATRGGGQPSVNPRMSWAVSRGTSSWGQWPTPSSSIQSAVGNAAR